MTEFGLQIAVIFAQVRVQKRSWRRAAGRHVRQALRLVMRYMGLLDFAITPNAKSPHYQPLQYKQTKITNATKPLNICGRLCGMHAHRHMRILLYIICMHSNMHAYYMHSRIHSCMHAATINDSSIHTTTASHAAIV